jgi:hypothetical protein
MPKYAVKYQLLGDPSFPDFLAKTVDAENQRAVVDAIRDSHEGLEIRIATVRNTETPEKPKTPRKKIAIQVSIVLLMLIVMASRYLR